MLLLLSPVIDDESSLLADRCALVAGRHCLALALVSFFDPLSLVLLVEVLSWYHANQRAYNYRAKDYAAVAMQARKAHFRITLSATVAIYLFLNRRPYMFLPILLSGWLPRWPTAAMAILSLPNLIAGFAGMEWILRTVLFLLSLYGLFCPTQVFTALIAAASFLECFF